MGNLIDPNQHNSFSNKLRRKRFSLFLSMMDGMPKTPIKILDVGGTETFWENMNFGVSPEQQKSVEITLLNLDLIKVKYPNFKSVVGDARSMPEFATAAFDIVFSNSVIEHVGNFNDQKMMADEIKRIGKQYYIQTPNYHFPIEPHFLFPFFQFLPLNMRARLINKYHLGNTKRIPNKNEAIAYVKNLQLLSFKNVSLMFPDATIYREKFLGLTKSFVCIRKAAH